MTACCRGAIAVTVAAVPGVRLVESLDPSIYAKLAESMPVALVIYRVDFDDLGNSRWVFANEAVVLESVLRGAPAVGKTIRETSPAALLPMHGGPSIVERWERAARSGKAETLEFEYRQSTGELIWYRAHYVPLGDRLVATIYENITDRKRTERELDSARADVEERMQESVSELRRTREQLQMAQRLEALGRLAGGIAHDFNNMLSVIMSAAGLARRKTGTGDLKREIGQIEAAADRAAELTRQLLAFSRRQLLEPRSVSLNEVVRQTEPMLQRLIGENIAICIELEAELERVLVDPAKMEQVLVNLAVNARDAMPDGGTLTIATDNATASDAEIAAAGLPHAGPWVTLSVRDTGHGMAPETLEHIFEPFFTTKAEGVGTGLGLAMVFGIVTQSDGHIAVASEPRRGSSFTIYLPPTDEAATEDAIEPVPDSIGGSEIVLVVEDDPLVRRAACRVLSAKGYAVLEAGSAEEALDVARDHHGPVDALLTDMILPGMNGLELARRLRRDHDAMRVVCMSGYVDDKFGAGPPPDDGIAFISKPFDPESIARKLRTMLDR